MTTLDDVALIALSLPETEERPTRGHRAWWTGGKLFVWERPLRARDVAELGDAAPEGIVLGARVEHELAKHALIAERSEVFFTTSHFDGNPAVLVRLDAVDEQLLDEIVIEAWLQRAREPVAARWLRMHR